VDSRKSVISTLAAVAGAVAILGTGSAGAADWSFEPRVAISGEYNDNQHLTEASGTEVKVSGAALDALVTLRADTPRSSVSLTPRLAGTYYPGDSDEETNSQSVRLVADHKTQKVSVSFDASYDREDLLWGYLPTVDATDALGNPVRGEDISSSEIRNKSEQFDVLPSLSVMLSPRYALDFGVGYLDVQYSQQVENESISYTYLNAYTALRYLLSETSQLKFTGAAGRYEPVDAVDTTGYGLTAEWSRRFSDTAQWYMRGGFNRIETADVGDDLKWENGFSGGAGVRWQWEVTGISLDAMHFADPNSTGSVVNRDLLQFWLSRQLRPLVNLYFGARAIRDSGVGSDSTFQDRDYATGTLAFEWRFSRQFALNGSYTYFWRKYQDAASDAQSNAVSLGVVYEPERR